MLSRVILLLVLVTLALTIGLHMVEAQPPCAADVKKFCADVPAREGRIPSCLRKHGTELSEECREGLDDLARQAGLLGATCRWDIGWFCSDVEPGDGRIVSCLENHVNDLSPQCRDQVVEPAK